MSANETIADIVAEKRDRANEIERDVAEKMASGKMVSAQYAREVIAELRKEADRIEAAAKRGCSTQKSENRVEGNSAAMREALVCISNAPIPPRKIHVMSEGIGVIIHEPEIENEWLELLRYYVDMANSALSAPPRNCDVGTAEEQGKRFQEFCDDSQTDEDFCSMCTRCSLKKEGHCEIAWAQMSYEKGGEE